LQWWTSDEERCAWSGSVRVSSVETETEALAATYGVIGVTGVIGVGGGLAAISFSIFSTISLTSSGISHRDCFVSFCKHQSQEGTAIRSIRVIHGKSTSCHLPRFHAKEFAKEHAVIGESRHARCETCFTSKGVLRSEVHQSRQIEIQMSSPSGFSQTLSLELGLNQ
jgi:hypothetical protein